MSSQDSLALRKEVLLAAIAEGKIAEANHTLARLHPSDVADVLESLSEADRLLVLRALPAELASETLAEMEEDERAADLLAAMAPHRGAKLLSELADDDATDLVADLQPEERARILAEMPVEEAGEIRELLAYPEESAGGIMTAALVSVRETLTAGQAIEEVRRQGREVEDFYTVWVVDGSGRLVGTVPLDDLILAEPVDPVSSLVEPVVAAVHPDEDQEEVGRLMARYNLPTVPVVGPRGRLVGRITFDDVLDVMEAEQTEDILRFGGVSDEESLGASWVAAVRTRLPWLVLNLLTATAAALVVYFYSDTVQSAVILAVVMPVIAGMGGNAGSQALAVTVRRLALRDDVGADPRAVVGKEVLVGLVNGAVLGGIVAGASLLVPGGDPRLGLVVLVSMWGTMLMAGFGGAFIPMLLHRLGFDPAVASSVFLHTTTDFLGFMLLLGLATALLM